MGYKVSLQLMFLAISGFLIEHDNCSIEKRQHTFPSTEFLNLRVYKLLLYAFEKGYCILQNGLYAYSVSSALPGTVRDIQQTSAYVNLMQIRSLYILQFLIFVFLNNILKQYLLTFFLHCHKLLFSLVFFSPVNKFNIGDKLV